MIPRFFKKGFLRLSDRVHDVIDEISPEARILSLLDESMAVIHFNYIDINHFLEKGINGYTSIEALNMFTGKKRKLEPGSLLLKAIEEIAVRMLLQKGYKDGFVGFYLSIMMAIYGLNSYAKLRLMEELNTPEVGRKILEIYSEMAKKVLDEYA